MDLSWILLLVVTTMGTGRGPRLPLPGDFAGKIEAAALLKTKKKGKKKKIPKEEHERKIHIWLYLIICNLQRFA